MQASTVLLDTGPLVALLDQNDVWHRTCVDTWHAAPPPFLTSMAVVTEAMHFLLDRGASLGPIFVFLKSGAVRIEPLGQDDIPAIEALMLKCAHRPMDLADATLVLLARRYGIATVFTIDRDDFETYRIDGRKRFHVVPERH